MGEYVNEQRDERTKHNGDGKGGSKAFGSGQVKSSAVGDSGTPAASFVSAESFLGVPATGELAVGGTEVVKGSSSVPGVELDKGSSMIGESATSKVGKAKG